MFVMPDNNNNHPSVARGAAAKCLLLAAFCDSFALLIRAVNTFNKHMHLSRTGG